MNHHQLARHDAPAHPSPIEPPSATSYTSTHTDSSTAQIVPAPLTSADEPSHARSAGRRMDSDVNKSNSILHLDETGTRGATSTKGGAGGMGHPTSGKRARAGDAGTLAQASAMEHSMTPLQAIRAYWRAFAWCMFACVGALLWGYDAQVGGGTLSVPVFRRDFGYAFEDQWVLPARWQSAFNSASSIGGLFGALGVGIISDKVGRRWTIAIACFISVVAVFVQFFTPPHVNAMLLVGKLVNGVALGMFVASASGYCSEVSPLALRGITTGSVNLWIVLGQFISNCVIEATGPRTDRYAYRIPLYVLWSNDESPFDHSALQWIFPVILLVGLPFAPESPWYLVRQHRPEDAHAVIVRLGGPDVDADLHLRQIRDTIELEDRQAASTTYSDCFRGTNRRRTIIALMVFILQQIAGVVFVLGFSSYFFQLAGFDTANAFRLGVGVTAIGVVGNLISLFTVNSFGRRPLFFWGMIGCAVVNLIVGFSSLADTAGARWSMAAFTIIYNFIYQIGIGPLGYVIYSEVGSAKLRSKTVGIGICVNQICGCVANVVIPYLVNPDEADLGGKVGFIFGGLGLIGSLWTWFYIPETKNRTIDELDALFEARVPPRKFASTDVKHLVGERV